MKKTKWMPEGYHTVTPYLVVKNASQFLYFMKQAFAAKECIKHVSENGEINHGEVEIGDSKVMFGSASGKVRPFPAMLHLYVKDADAIYQRALKAGAISLREPQDRPFGDRTCGVKDAWGNQWWIATHIENVSPEEIERMNKV